MGVQVWVGVARIMAANVLHVGPRPLWSSAWPPDQLLVHDQLHTAPDFSARPLTLELLDALGRPVRQQPVTSAVEQTMS